MSTEKRIAVIGAGMAGLSAAHRLQKSGFTVTVFERQDKVGGRTLTHRTDEFQFDTGAILISPNYSHLNRLIKELGIDKALVKVEPKMGFVRNGEVHTLDLSSPISSFLKTPLLSIKSKLMIVKLLPRLIKLAPNINYENMGALAIFDNESTEAYCKRVLNQELHDYFIDPIIRINMLNKTHLSSSGELFWLLKALAAPYVSAVANGTSVIAEALAENIDVATSTEVRRVEQNNDKLTIHFSDNGGPQSQVFDGCIVSAAPAVAQQLCDSLPTAEQSFFPKVQSIKHMVISVGLNKELPLNASTILGSEKETPNMLTIVLDPNRAPGRSANGSSVMTLWMADDWSQERWHQPDDEVLASALGDVQSITGDLRGHVVSSLVTRQYHSCFKGYPGYYTHVDHYMKNKTRKGRLLFAGDMVGMGTEAAVISGEAAADDLIANIMA